MYQLTLRLIKFHIKELGWWLGEQRKHQPTNEVIHFAIKKKIKDKALEYKKIKEDNESWRKKK